MTKKKTETQEDLPTQNQSSALTDAGANKPPVRGITTVGEWLYSPSALVQMGDSIPRDSSLTSERFRRLLWTAIQKTPALKECTIESMSSCAFDMCSLDLNPGAIYGEAHLIPFKNTCTLILGFKGLMKIAIRSGGVERFDVELVYDCDEFKVKRGLYSDLIHNPDYRSKERTLDNIIGAYSVAVLAGGEKVFDFMTRVELDKIGDAAIAKARGKQTPWTTHKEEMYKKSVTRHHCKMLPVYGKDLMAINQDADNERTGYQTIDVNAEVVEPKKTAPVSIQQATQQITEEVAEGCATCGVVGEFPNGLCSECQSEADVKS